MSSKLYNSIIAYADPKIPARFRPLWMHQAGPKTIFFWGPLFKWGLVVAGLKDLSSKPPELISIPQSMSLALTGVIWSRYSVVIIPKNYSLLSVNAFVALTQGTQLYRALKFKYSSK
jgi:hypothetical protein